MTTSSMTANDRRPPFAIEPEITPADLRRGAWSSLIGSALEYYDFALYSLASALIFGPLFFPSFNPAVGLLASFGTYFLGFAVRPVGGVSSLGFWATSLGENSFC